MGGWWQDTCSFLGCCFWDLVKTTCGMRFVSVHVVHPYDSMASATAWKKSGFNSSDKSDFRMIIYLWIIFHAFSWHTLISLSVHEMLFPKYESWFTDFRGLSFRVEIAPFCLKHIFIYIKVNTSSCLLGDSSRIHFSIFFISVHYFESIKNSSNIYIETECNR